MELCAGHRSGAEDRCPRRASLTTRRRTAATGTAVAAFLSFGLTSLAAPPDAHADELGLAELISDLLGSGGDTTVGTADVLNDAGAAPMQAALEAGGRGFDHAPASADRPHSLAALFETPGPAAETLSAGNWFQQLIYAPVHDAVEGWINSSDPTPVLDWLNGFSTSVGLGPMIADGAAGNAEHLD